MKASLKDILVRSLHITIKAMANKKTMANFILKVSKRLARRKNDNEIPLILKDANKAFYSALLMRTKLVPLCCFGTCRNN